MRNKFCLKSSSSFKQINQAQTNTSKTKQTFSFSRSSRFMDPKPQCKDNTYNGDAMKSRKSGAGIGYGTRFDFTKQTSISPSSSHYKLKTIFDQNYTQNKGYSLRLSRQKIKFFSYIDSSLSRVPSCNKYQNDKTRKIKVPIYSMGKKTKIIDKTMSLLPQNNYPGPGNYQNNPEDLNLNSSYGSKFNRIRYGTNKSKRFDSNGDQFSYSDNHVPGPGQYRETSNLSNVGKYVVSSYAGGTNAKFDCQRRISKFQTKACQAVKLPGPGYYKIPSQFGQYDGNIYQQLQTINVPSKLTNKKYIK